MEYTHLGRSGLSVSRLCPGTMNFGPLTPPLRRLALEANRDRIAAYEDLCGELGEEPAAVALAWLLHQDGVTAPVTGPRTRGQLGSAQRALSLKLGDDVLKRLDEIFPGYRPAPEHYAW